MPLSKDDRIAFSLNIVSSDEKIKAFDLATGSQNKEIEKLTKLDSGNKNLFDPINNLVTSYQNELGKLDGIGRFSIQESDIVNSANRTVPSYFFPNDMNISVPSLTSTNNVWIKIPPFALSFAIGKNYTEGYGSLTKESDVISNVLSIINTILLNPDINNTTGQKCGSTGTCSLPIYTNQSDCLANGGIWTPGPDAITTDATIHQLKTNLVDEINALKLFLEEEVSLITLNDPDSAKQAQNDAAINHINNTISAINLWLSYVDFNTGHGQTTCPGFNSYDANLLAPTKLHSSQLSALQSSLNSRVSFFSTRIAQITSNLGNISQDISTGNVSGSGLYFKRYRFLSMRLHALDGSLTKLTLSSGVKGAQDSIKNNIVDTKNAYMELIPTSLFKSPGNGTSTLSLVDTSFLSTGDSVWIVAENQEELIRGIKSVNGNTVTLNDVVPAKYTPGTKARLYKDLT